MGDPHDQVVGSFLLGFVLKVAGDRDWPDAATAAIGIGFLGAYTTFSTFSVETHTLLRDGRTAAAGLYVAVSLLAGVAAAALGYAVAGAVSSS